MEVVMGKPKKPTGKLVFPPAPTARQLEEIVHMAYNKLQPEVLSLATNISHLLMDSEEMMGVIRKWAETAGLKVSTAGSIFTGGFITGYLVMWAMVQTPMKEEDSN